MGKAEREEERAKEGRKANRSINDLDISNRYKLKIESFDNI